MYCNRCGKPIPDGSMFCNSCGAPQGQPIQNRHINPRPPQEISPQPLSASYLAISWVIFGLLLVWAAFKGFSGLSSGNEFAIYKAIVIALSACIFIPQIRIKSLDELPGVVLLIKMAVAGLLIFLL